MQLALLALLTAFFFGAYNVFIKVASGSIHQIVGAVILQVVAALLGLVILLVLRFMNTPFEISQKGITYSILAGLMVGLAEIASFYVFSKGLNASIGIPIIIGGSIVVGTSLGLLFLKESLETIHIIAIIMIVAGVGILAAK